MHPDGNFDVDRLSMTGTASADRDIRRVADDRAQEVPAEPGRRSGMRGTAWGVRGTKETSDARVGSGIGELQPHHASAFNVGRLG